MQESSDKSTDAMSVSRAAVLDFLKTAIVVDDKIGSDRSIDDPKAAQAQLQNMSQPPSYGSASNPKPTKSTDEVVPKFETIVRSFFDMGVLCSLHKPTFPNDDVEGEVERIVNACESADIIILDWYLRTSTKTHQIVPRIIDRLLSSDLESGQESSHNVFIYSCENVDVATELSKQGLNAKKLKNGLYSVRGTQIYVFTKSSVPEDALAERIIECIVKRYDGVLPSFALQGVSAIRRNTKRLLGRFKGELDTELALHAVLTRDDGDLREQLIELLANEVLPAIEDDKRISDSGAVYSRLKNHLLQIKGWEAAKTALGPRMIKESVDAESLKGALCDRLVTGREATLVSLFEGCESVRNCAGKTMSSVKQAVARLRGVEHTKIGGFASLMSNRASYKKEKVLRCGTVVEEVASNGKKMGTYVCIVPTCDALRLQDSEKGVELPFWQLDKDGPRQGSNGIGIVVGRLTSKGEVFSTFFVKGKFHEHATMKRIVLGVPGLVFPADGIQGENGCKLMWVGQLKDFHAQRVMQFVASSLSKVGLLEDDWLRRLAGAN